MRNSSISLAQRQSLRGPLGAATFFSVRLTPSSPLVGAEVVVMEEEADEREVGAVSSEVRSIIWATAEVVVLLYLRLASEVSFIRSCAASCIS